MNKTIRYIYVAACVAVMLSMNANAYIDPSVMTYAIQIVAGVAVAAGALISVMWRRAKKNIQNKLGIDENANKEVEEDVVEFTDNNNK